jgi:hypothetical protein
VRFCRPKSVAGVAHLIQQEVTEVTEEATEKRVNRSFGNQGMRRFEESKNYSGLVRISPVWSGDLTKMQMVPVGPGSSR